MLTLVAAVLVYDRAVVCDWTWETCELRSSGCASLKAMSETRVENDIMSASDGEYQRHRRDLLQEMARGKSRPLVSGQMQQTCSTGFLG